MAHELRILHLESERRFFDILDHSPVAIEEIGVELDLLPRVFHSSTFPLRDGTGTPYALCGISSDITERKRAEQAMSIARREAERANRGCLRSSTKG
jgi:PAS domain-containing protein